jgi:microcystin-dependent protein
LASSNVGTDPNPANAIPSQSPQIQIYIEDVPSANAAANAITSVGGSQPHTNFQPYMCVDFIISLFGIFPSQT